MAQYSINSFIVTFNDYDETVLKTETVEYEKSATAPTDPTLTGYTFTGWDVDYSNITSDLIITVQYILTTNIVEMEDVVIQVYPNATKGLITVDLSDNYTNVTKIQVLDLSGKSMYTQKVNSAIITLDLSVFSKGIYIIKAQTTEQTFYKKVMFE